MTIKNKVLAAVVTCTIALFGQSVVAAERPNIIHILVDDVGYDDIGIFGAKDIKTPNLDALAENGTYFTNFYAPHPTCTPSRASLLTGRYAPRVNDGEGIGILWPNSKRGLMPKKEKSVAKLLRDAGYQTALIGKWHLGDHVDYLPTKHGFDKYFGIPHPNDHGPERWGNTNSQGLDKIPLVEGTKVVRRLDNNELSEVPAEFVREAAKFMRDSVAAKRPFFLQYSNIETHTPWFVPKGFNGYSEAGEFGDSVEYMDRSVGVLLDQMRRLKIRDNTLIIFSSDNGPLVKEYKELEAAYGKFADVDTERAKKHLLRDGKYQARYEGGPRVAFIINWPGVIPEGQKRDQIIDGTDVFSTMLAAAGVDIPTDRVIDGENIIPVAQDKFHKGIRNTFYAFTGDGILMGVRVGDWKLSVPHRKTWAISKNKKPALFNLAKDPHEDNDVSSKHQSIVKKMLKLADQAKKDIKEGKPLQKWVRL